MFLYRRDELKSHKFKVLMNPLTYSEEVEVSLEELEKYLKEMDGIVSIAGTIFIGHNHKLSFLNEIEKELMDKRKIYKNNRDSEMEKGNTDAGDVYECMQKAYKILANALYGVLLNEYFRFYNVDLGISITLSGREAIRYAGYHVSRLMKEDKNDIDPNFDIDYDEKDIPYVTYSDTDSIYLQIGDYIMDKGII
jgi:DNA polymerase elongation subunit (family B)